MDRKERIEMFLLIRKKMEEIAEIVKEHKIGHEFMATYCFGLSCDESEEDTPQSYEFLAGYSVDERDELDLMFNVMSHSYESEHGDDDDDEPTNTIEYWLNK